MGMLARITGRGKASGNTNDSSSLASGGHAIDSQKVLCPTDPTVINPMNAGSWETVRTAPVSDTPRYFNKTEADALKKLATQKAQEAKQAKRAYKSLKKLEISDAEVHVAHRGYIRGVAENELTKKRSDVKTARALHAQRPEYAKLGIGLDRADNSAQRRIEELKAKVKDKY
ncbi:hypothetical protein NIES4075_74310 [Tolypothrix sp. NIES-4075]|uniref:hypothetical protein n=1 Tax=Tolypothrix sp. NIES-4075 TaxID=2005459 RepID=UPI000B5C422A|nr:hypothetical protein [Tolypothrix sp. NIES-4075]GAX46407.1 hypothetical protein NIES4075_74310 [Tolypothrix sp. NIES-4075]